MIFIFTWNLTKNCQVTLLQFQPTEAQPAIALTKGVSERSNYFIPSSSETFYDLRFTFPLNFFKGSQAWKNHKTNFNFIDNQQNKDFDAYF